MIEVIMGLQALTVTRFVIMSGPLQRARTFFVVPCLGTNHIVKKPGAGIYIARALLHRGLQLCMNVVLPSTAPSTRGTPTIIVTLFATVSDAYHQT